MLGIFDSGMGGYNSLNSVRQHFKRENIILLSDRKNAPYGTKSRREILRITKENIKILKALGCRKILIACCTASTLYPYLTDEEREIATDSLLPTVERVKKTHAFRVTMLATRHTATDGALSVMLPDVSLTPISAQPLVKFIDEGSCDRKITLECKSYLDGLLSKVKATEPECVILGCTHFHSLKKTIQKLLGTPVISSAHEGAVAFVKNIKEELAEDGKTLLLS